MKKIMPWAASGLLVVFCLFVGGAAAIASGDSGFGFIPGGLGEILGTNNSSQTTQNTPHPNEVENAQNTQNSIKPSQKNKSNSSSVNVQSGLRANRIGIFISDAPENPASSTHLKDIAALGFDTVFNYSSFDGDYNQVLNYLNLAKSLNISVVFSLKDLYDQLPNGTEIGSSYPAYGQNNIEVATNVVRLYKDHPATYGFAITDEAPLNLSSLNSWQNTLQDRYNLVKSLTAKPVMQVHIAYSGGSSEQRKLFLNSLKSSTDVFAIDYYPIPYFSYSMISNFSSELASINKNSWFIVQAFSWARYPQTAQGLGYNLSIARSPSTAEMVDMANLSLKSGIKNIFFYSYFDLSDNAQKANLKQAVSTLRSQ